MSMTEAERNGHRLASTRSLTPKPYNAYMVVLYTPDELDDYLTYRRTDKDNNFVKLLTEQQASDVIDLDYPNQCRCLVLSDMSICLYIPSGIHHSGLTLVREIGVLAASAALEVAVRCGTVFDVGSSWVTQTQLIGYLQAHLIMGVCKYTDNVMAMVHPLVKRFDNSMYNWQVEEAMQGLTPTECQQAMYRQNLERQNHVVVPGLKSWISTTYYQ